MLLPTAGIILALCLLIGGHELGHFLMARLLSIKVLRFAIGFGKPIWRKQAKSGIEYVMGIIPLGGYAKLLDEREGPVAGTELASAFNRRPLWQRFAVVLAGPIANFTLAFLLYWLVFCLGVSHLKPTIASVVPGSIAAQANIPKDSTLKAANGHVLHSWSEFSMTVLSRVGNSKALTLELVHEDSTLLRNMSLQHWKMPPLHASLLSSLGIVAKTPSAEQLSSNPSSYIVQQKYGLWQAGKTSAQQTLRYIIFNFVMTYKLALGIISLQSLSGPLTIFHGIQFALQQGFISYLQTLAMLSIAIGFINLLPIPTLDGGHMVLLLVEAVKRKPLSLAAQLLAYRLGFIVLMLLMVKALTNDMLRLFA